MQEPSEILGPSYSGDLTLREYLRMSADDPSAALHVNLGEDGCRTVHYTEKDFPAPLLDMTLDEACEFVSWCLDRYERLAAAGEKFPAFAESDEACQGLIDKWRKSR
jgi:hypothetical protein